MLTCARLKVLLRYVKKHGVFKWRIAKPKVNIGDVAGTINGAGYVQISIDGKLYLAHRLAYLYVEGRFPKNLIDHRDGVRSNNRWSNLRDCSYSQNRLNSKISVKNSSGFKGVTYDPRRGKWLSRAKIDKKSKHLGYFDSAEDASLAYQNHVKVSHGQFYKTTGV